MAGALRRALPDLLKLDRYEAVLWRGATARSGR